MGDLGEFRIVDFGLGVKEFAIRDSQFAILRYSLVKFFKLAARALASGSLLVGQKYPLP